VDNLAISVEIPKEIPEPYRRYLEEDIRETVKNRISRMRELVQG